MEDFGHMAWRFYGNHVLKGCLTQICILSLNFCFSLSLDFMTILFQTLYIFLYFWYFSNFLNQFLNFSDLFENIFQIQDGVYFERIFWRLTSFKG